MHGLAWSPSGAYLLAATTGDSAAISVWNVKTGRHRGQLIGGPTDVSGFALLADSGELVAGSSDGMIRFWDFAAVTRQIGDLEESLRSP